MKHHVYVHFLPLNSLSFVGFFFFPCVSLLTCIMHSWLEVTVFLEAAECFSLWQTSADKRCIFPLNRQLLIRDLSISHMQNCCVSWEEKLGVHGYITVWSRIKECSLKWKSTENICTVLPLLHSVIYTIWEGLHQLKNKRNKDNMERTQWC